MDDSKPKTRLRFQPSAYLRTCRALVRPKTFMHLMARFLPWGGGLRTFLHRARGVKIYGNVWIGDDVYLDEDYPETIEIHDGVVIAPRCTIIGHTRGSGKIIIERNAAIAAGCTIVCGPGQTLRIGEGAVLSAGSTVSHDIPPRTLCGPPRVKMYAEVTVPFTLETPYEDFRRGLRPLRTQVRKPAAPPEEPA